MTTPTWAQQLCAHAQAQVDERVRACLRERGVSDSQINDFGIGYVDGKLPPLAYPKVFLEWCWEGRRLDGFYLLPLTTALGNLAGFQFRAVDRDRKLYSDYMLVQDEPSTVGLTQALPAIWQQGAVWIVEGAFDLFPVQRCLPNAIPTLTARVPYPLVRLLKRVAKHVWLMYDADKTGHGATEWFVKQHGKDFTVHTVKVPIVQMASGKMAKDPGDLWEAWGDEKLASWLRAAQDGPWQW